jgi:hypothetical protein
VLPTWYLVPNESSTDDEDVVERNFHILIEKVPEISQLVTRTLTTDLAKSYLPIDKAY